MATDRSLDRFTLKLKTINFAPCTEQEGHDDFVGQMSNNSQKEVVMCLFCGQLERI